MWRGTVICDMEYGGERWCEIWRGTLMWNMVDNFDVE